MKVKFVSCPATFSSCIRLYRRTPHVFSRPWSRTSCRSSCNISAWIVCIVKRHACGWQMCLGGITALGLRELCAIWRANSWESNSLGSRQMLKFRRIICLHLHLLRLYLQSMSRFAQRLHFCFDLHARDSNTVTFCAVFAVVQLKWRRGFRM